MEETSSPRIIHLIGHQVLCHPSEHASRSMREQVRAKVHIAMLYKFTVSDITECTEATVDESAQAILRIEGS